MDDRSAPTHLLVYEFEPGAQFQGELLGALERLEAGGALRVLEALFVRREPGDGELSAVHLRGRGSGLTAPLLSFRLDAAARRKATRAALEGESGATLLELGDALEPGAALAAVLIEYTWAEILAGAVARIGGREVASGLVGATELASLMEDLRLRSRDAAP